MKFSVVAASAACFAGAFAAPVEKRQVGQVLTIVQSLYDQVTQYTGAINSTLSAVNLPVADGVKDQVTNQVAGQLKSVTSLIDSLLDKTKDLTDLTKGLDGLTGGLTKSVSGATGAAIEGKNSGLPLVGGLTSGLPVVGSLGGLGGLTSVTKNLPVIGGLGLSKRQVDTSAVTQVAAKLVTEITSTVGGINKTKGLGDLTSSIQPLGKSVSTLLGDLDNVVGGVFSTVINVLKALGLEVEVDLLKLDISTKPEEKSA